MTDPALTPDKRDRLSQQLSIAIDGFRFDEARRLLAAGADPNYRRRGYEPMLTFVAAYDSAVMVELLINHGADVHACDDDGQTALAAALETAEMDSVRLLMKYGASLNQQQVAGETAPPYLAGILSDCTGLSIERTSFVLRHHADLSLTFTYKSRPGCTIADVMAQLRATTTDRNRNTVGQVCFMLEQAIAKRAHDSNEARLKDIRQQGQTKLQRNRRGDFKL